jgi:hypothetical protein
VYGINHQYTEKNLKNYETVNYNFRVYTAINTKTDFTNSTVTKMSVATRILNVSGLLTSTAGMKHSTLTVPMITSWPEFQVTTVTATKTEGDCLKPP